MKSSNNIHRARYIGFIFSTTECGLSAWSDEGALVYLSLPMTAKASWHGEACHYLEHVPVMMTQLLNTLLLKGWTLHRNGYLSQAWRQHDLAIIGKDASPLVPALSWQCNAAGMEAKILNEKVKNFSNVTGRIENRFVAAKLPWALKHEPNLKKEIHQVMLSGDWVAGCLTQQWRLSTSDALCNGLLRQHDKTLAFAELQRANKVFSSTINPRWFPDPIESSEVVGTVKPSSNFAWREISGKLKGWKVVSSLGDNQATAAGSGASTEDTLVVSLGTSGTVNRVCSMDAQLSGKASRFEFWDKRLLLLMLAECGSWLNTYMSSHEPARKVRELSDMAFKADLTKIEKLSPPKFNKTYAPRFSSGLGAKEKIASVQFSIAKEMLKRTSLMINEVKASRDMIKNVVLTGGMTQAPLVLQLFRIGMQKQLPHARLLVNNHRPGISHKSDSFGALLNAKAAHKKKHISHVISEESRLIEVKGCNKLMESRIRSII